MEPDPKKLKPSGFGEQGSEETNPQLNRPLYANFPRRFAIGSYNEGPIIVSQPAQSTSEATRGEQAGHQNLVNEVKNRPESSDNIPLQAPPKGEIVEFWMKVPDFDRCIREIKAKFKRSSEDDNNKRWNVVTKKDLESFPILQKMLRVVKALLETETTIDPNPSQGVTCRSTTGNVNVYLASENHKIILQINPNSRMIQISRGQEAAPDIPEPVTPDNVDDYYLLGSDVASISNLLADPTDNLPPSLDEVLGQKPKPYEDDT